MSGCSRVDNMPTLNYGCESGFLHIKLPKVFSWRSNYCILIITEWPRGRKGSSDIPAHSPVSLSLIGVFLPGMWNLQQKGCPKPPGSLPVRFDILPLLSFPHVWLTPLLWQCKLLTLLLSPQRHREHIAAFLWHCLLHVWSWSSSLPSHRIALQA